MTRSVAALALSLATTSLLSGCAAEATSSSVDEEQAAAVTAASTEPPVALSGEYSFSGQVNALGRMSIDVIMMGMSDAQERLDRARAEGANCSRPAYNTYRCTNGHGAEAVPQTSLAKIGAANLSLTVAFMAPTASPTRVSVAEGLVEWTVHQPGSSPLGSFDAYTYLSLGNGRAKILLPGTNGQDLELIVVDSSHLARFGQVRDHEGEWRWHEDTGTAILQN